MAYSAAPSIEYNLRIMKCDVIHYCVENPFD